jgi:Na+/proline symporter/signal transduction histidine kinase/CheY-like chemotaxis protein
MFPNWQLVSISLLYICLLFLIAYLGDKYRHHLVGKRQGIIYAMTLGVYCTSWSFLGTTGQASTNILSHLPIYLGPILLFIFAWPFIQRIVRVSLKLNLTSIADILASRFGKSHNLAILVTIVSFVGTMPYVALQLKAMVYSFQQLQIDQSLSRWHIGIVVSIVLAAFSMLFGIRNIDVTERHPGVMLAIAFESLVKITAFMAVGLFVCFVLFDSPMDLWQKAGASVQVSEQFNQTNLSAMLAMLVIVMGAFLTLPRQFQVMVVELKEQKDTWLSRRIFPIYLLIFALFAIPLALAGQLLLGNSVTADSYVLFLPNLDDQRWLTLFVFLGAVSAASSMVIIATIALSTMISNEIVFPLLYRKNKVAQRNFDQFRKRLLAIRKVIILFVIMSGYLVLSLASPDRLSALGEVAFGAFAQLTPALIAAFYWRRATLVGVYGGIFVGFILWFTLNFLPQFGLYPLAFAEGPLPAKSMATLFSLSANIVVMWMLSQISRQSVQEKMQASQFLEWQLPILVKSLKSKQVNIEELELLASRFVGAEKAQKSFSAFTASHHKKKLGVDSFNQQLLEHTENILASVMGASSARLVLSSALDGRDIVLDELAVLVEDASSQRQRFSQNLLQSAIENASEGISIVDENLNLVAWNKKYLDLFKYPANLMYVGCPIDKLIRYNAEQGRCGVGDVEKQVSRRITFLKQGLRHESERKYKEGQTIRIEGNPLPDGGFVMMFSDITAYREAEKVLQEANLDLESRVNERTLILAKTNKALADANEKAAQANAKKSQYLQACGHDLMQPLEAARLFSSALNEQGGLSASQQKQVANIDRSLKAANDLVSDLAEIARLDSDKISLNMKDFPLKELFDELLQEFDVLAKEQSVEFRLIPTTVWVYSDKHLLRRIIQNLVGNAFRYAANGKVLLGARVFKGNVIIQVLDNGPGIPKDKQAMVFEQFTQLDSANKQVGQGLGLGLNITQSLARLMSHHLDLKSEIGQGCKFSVCLKRAQERKQVIPVTHSGGSQLTGVTVLCIDNDPEVLNGMVALLSAWQCHVIAANSRDQALLEYKNYYHDIDILLVDYQLGEKQHPEHNRVEQIDGLTLIHDIRAQSLSYLPAILITATTEAGIEEKAQSWQVGYMKKVIKPAALRAMMSVKLAEKLQADYS